MNHSLNLDLSEDRWPTYVLLALLGIELPLDNRPTATVDADACRRACEPGVVESWSPSNCSCARPTPAPETP